MTRTQTIRTLAALTAAVGLAAVAAPAGAAAVYDVVDGFVVGAGASNPNGVWSYGTGLAGHTDDPGNFKLLTIYQENPCADGGGLACYQSSTVWDRVPLVAKNTTGAPVFDFNTVVQPDDVLNVHPGPFDNDAVVRFTAPTAGTYDYSGFFQTLDTNPHGVTVGIYAGATQLYSLQFLGAAAQTSPSLVGGGKTPFSGGIHLAAGQSLDFIVNRHYGNDDSYYNDSTGLNLSVAAVPEASTWALMLLGFGGLGAVLRRRRARAVFA